MNFKKAIVVVASLALLSSPCFADQFANGIGNDVEEQAWTQSGNGLGSSSAFGNPGTDAGANGYNNANAGSIARSLDNPIWGTAEVDVKTDTPIATTGALTGNILGADVAAAGSLTTAASETHADAKGDFTRGGLIEPKICGGHDVELYNSRPSNDIGDYPGMVDTSGGLFGQAGQDSNAWAQQNDTWAGGGQFSGATYELSGLDDEQKTVVTGGFRLNPGFLRPGAYAEEGYIHSEHEAYGDAFAAGGTVAFAYDRPNFATAGGLTVGASGSDIDVVKGDSYDTYHDAQGAGQMEHHANIDGWNETGNYFSESNGFASYEYNGYKAGAGVAGTAGYAIGDVTGSHAVSSGFAASTGGLVDPPSEN
jgi:hypothetical protein